MSVITVEGRAGSSAPEVARRVADELGLDFIDRLLLADIARRVGSTVEAIADTERRVPTMASRFANLIQRMLHRSALAGMGGDPYFGPGIETLLSRPYHEMENAPATTAEEIDEQRFIDTTAEVIRDLAEIGNVVIMGRGGAAILRDRPDVLRIGALSMNKDRLVRIMAQERLSEEAAREFLLHTDGAQERYYQRAFDTGPLDPFLYHIIWNTSDVSIDYAVQVTVDAARVMANKGLK